MIAPMVLAETNEVNGVLFIEKGKTGKKQVWYKEGTAGNQLLSSGGKG